MFASTVTILTQSQLGHTLPATGILGGKFVLEANHLFEDCLTLVALELPLRALSLVIGEPSLLEMRHW
jgi:hypothetical protein